jgi:DNA-binding LytR/AlgR family response regulator
MALRAVILDDNENHIRLLEMELKDFPVKVEKRFTDPAQFLQEEKKLKYDFLFLDMNMPGMLGKDVIAKISKPVILITGESGNFAEIINDLEMQYKHFVCPLNKPVNEKRLSFAINKLQEKLAPKTHIDFNTSEGKKLINKNDIDLISSQDIDKGSEPQGEAKIVYLSGSKPLLVNSLNLEETFLKLDKKIFLKANRYDIINIRCIRSYTHDSLEIEYTSKNGQSKPATRTLGKEGKLQYKEMLG